MINIGKSFAATALAGAALLSSNVAAAQQGTITGTVVDAETGAPLAAASVEALGQDGPQGTSDTGAFTLQVAAGSHSLVVTLIGYETTRLDGVDVEAGGTTSVEIPVRSRALLLNPVVVTVSRTQEKALDAPASITTVSRDEVARATTPTLADHVRAVPGVDAAQTGLMSGGSVVARGFNNVFSGALLTIIDNRYARVPSLRFNAYSMLPITELDIERIEVSLGPGAALYGPNAAGGVLHMITPSPIDRPGTTITLAGGERSVFQGQLRTAARVSENIGLKVSGQFFRGNDWEHEDALEVVPRNNEGQRYSADARIDYRFGGDGSLVLNGGVANLSSGIELTGIGAAQVQDWSNTYAQLRLSKGRLFAQGFLNQTRAGDDTYLLRTHDPVVDSSRTIAAQFQYGFGIGSVQDFTYGVDWQRTEPRSGGTIFGRNEADDIITEVGAYLHSETSLGDKLDLVAAIRVDDHNRLIDANISPRAALVFKPTETQNFRFTYNRAFSTPTSTNLFLDIVAASLGLGFDVRARGVPAGGFTFADQCPGGHMGYCMRSPFAPGVQLPANGMALWDGILALLPTVDPALALVVPFLMQPGELPGDPAIGTVFRRLDQAAAATGGNPFPLDSEAIGPVNELVPTISNTFEFGYKGLLGDRVLLSADVYRARVENFVGPLSVITPNVFFDPASLGAFITHRLTGLIQLGLLAPSDVAAIVEAAASLPLGTVVPDQVDDSAVLVSYRNFGEVDYYGMDLAGQILASDRLRIDAAYSFQSDECFVTDGDHDDHDHDHGGDSCSGPRDIALNAPSHKGSLGVTYDDQVSGFSARGRFRFTDGFPMNSGVYGGFVDGYSVVDATLGYRLPFQRSTQVSLTINNLLNNMHREFVGAPEIGRLALLRVRYDF